MTKTNEIALRCMGMNCGKILVPEFTLPLGVTYGVSIPVAYDDTWTLLARTLSGELKNSNVELTAPGVSVLPLLGARRFSARTKVVEALSRLGLDTTRDEVVRALRSVTASTEFRNLPGTPRLILEILDALKTTHGILVFATSGLDPVGALEVNRLVNESGASALELFSSSLSKSGRFEKVITCVEVT
jgi:hypothetical protein